MKIKEFLNQVFMFSISGISVLAIITFIFKKIMERLINNIFDIKFEQFKNESKRLNEEHFIRYSKLHQDRAEVIKTVYSLICEVEDKLQRYISDFNINKIIDSRCLVKSDSLKKQEEFLLNTLIPKLELFTKKNKIFFSNELYSHLEVLIENFIIIIGSHMEYGDITKEGLEFMNTVKEDIIQVKEYLELEFRKLLGISI